MRDAALETLRRARRAGERVRRRHLRLPDAGGRRLHAGAATSGATRGCATTPIVMLTSVGGRTTRRAAASIGIDACLTKPVKHSDLLDALATLVRRVDHARPQAEPRGRVRARAAAAAASWSPKTIRSTASWSRRCCRSAATTSTAVENGREAVTAIDASAGAALRRGADGRADAGDERVRGDAGDSRARSGRRPARADRRAHRARDAGRSRALPGGRHGRLSVEADRRRTS